MKLKKSSIAISLGVAAAMALSLTACQTGNDGEYTVTFDTRGGSEIATLHLDEGEIVTRPAKDPTKAMFTFDGWYTDTTYTTPFEFGSAMPAHDITIYAGWVGQESVRVIFDANGGSFTDDAVTTHVGVSGDAIDMPTAPTRTGYSFGGWYLDEACTDAYAYNVFPAENTTLYAGWDKDSAYAYIEFYGNGKLIETLPVKKGETAEEPELFDEDITATKWYSDKEMINVYAFGGAIANDLKLYCTYYTDGIRIEDGVVVGYFGTASDVVIPDKFDGEPVTEIGAHAFYSSERTEIISVSVPATVTKIGRRAFYECSYLVDIGLTSSVTEIGEGAFCRAARLRTVGDITGVTEIKPSTFLGCENLRSITFGEGLTEIGEFAFSDCASLTEVVIPELVNDIYNDTFGGCKALRSVTIKSTQLSSVGVDAFRACNSLQTVVIESLLVPEFGDEANSPFAVGGVKVYVSDDILEEFTLRYGFLDDDTFGDKLEAIK